MLNKNEVLPQVELEMKAIFHKFFKRLKRILSWLNG